MEKITLVKERLEKSHTYSYDKNAGEITVWESTFSTTFMNSLKRGALLDKKNGKVIFDDGSEYPIEMIFIKGNKYISFKEPINGVLNSYYFDFEFADEPLFFEKEIPTEKKEDDKIGYLLLGSIALLFVGYISNEIERSKYGRSGMGANKRRWYHFIKRRSYKRRRVKL